MKVRHKAIYDIGVTPLIDMLIDIVITSTESQVVVLAYANDFSTAGKLDDLRKWWDTLTIIGPKFGYYSEPAKINIHRHVQIRYFLELRLR